MNRILNHKNCTINFISQFIIYIAIFISLSGFSKNTNGATINYTESYIVQAGDTILRYIDRENLSSDESKLLKKFFLNREYKNILKDGKQISFYYQAASQEKPILNMLTVELTKTKILEVYKKGNKFVGRYTKPFQKSITKLSFEIVNNDFINSLREAGISDDDRTLFNALNDKINLKRSLKKKNKLSLIVEKYTNQNRSIVEYRDVLYASLENNGRVVDVYRYHCPYDKVNKFYYSNGQSGSYSDLIKPIPDAKINSKFGYRIHPVSRVRKMHYGVDFGSPKGTPIYSASSGVIQFAGWLGGYGNYIKIQHDKKIKTEYGHLSKFAPGIKDGVKVSKGQLLGYVGSSGRTTGAHLHFSVLLKDKYVDPLAFNISSKSILVKNHYKSFINYKDMINILSKKLDKNIEVVVNNNTLSTNI